VETTPVGIPQETRENLQLARRMLGNTRALTHYAVQELRGGVAVAEALAPGLERTAEFWNRTGVLTVRVTLAEGTSALPERVSESLLAIAREAMTNAVKHGQATAIEVAVCFVDGTVQLRVQDNGCGFDPEDAQGERGHFGFQGMRERLTTVRGTLQIRSQSGQGTDLQVSVPTNSL